MARCGCAGGSCSCTVTGAGSVTVTGVGSVASPYVITGGGSLTVTDSATVDFTLTGAGSVASPYNITAAATLNLDALTDVQTAAATTGQVLAKQSDGQWRGVAASSATPGAINVSGGIEGDGSAGTPLSVKMPASGSGLIEDATGLRVEGAGAWVSYTPVLTTYGAGVDPTVGNGTLVGRYTQIGKLVFFKVTWTAGTTTSRGSGYLEVTVPVLASTSPIPQTNVMFHVGAVGVGDYRGGGLVNGDKIVRTWLNSGVGGRGVGVNHALPTTFVSGSQMIWDGYYEAA